jgi:hypothetical protein
MREQEANAEATVHNAIQTIINNGMDQEPVLAMRHYQVIIKTIQKKGAAIKNNNTDAYPGQWVFVDGYMVDGIKG